MATGLPVRLFKHRGFRALFSAQLLGAFNDNFLKMLVSLLAVDSAAAGQSGAYLSLVGIVFMSPYLVFAAYAGYVADVFDRRRVLVTAKALEIAIMASAFVALVYHRVDLLLPVLFLLATQATFFSPAKSGLLPEMIPAEALPRANGVLEMSRYAAVILGTGIGGLILDLWADRPAIIGSLLMVVAVIGCLAALRIPAAAASPGPKTRHLNPWSKFEEGIAVIARDRRLVLAISALSYFECLGALVLLDLILVGKEVMALDDTRISLLGAAAGCGIGIGCMTAGRMSRGRIAFGHVLAGGIGAGMAILALSSVTAFYVGVAAAIALVGFAGGFIVVPLNTALQSLTADADRGAVISTNNLFNMTAVFLSSGLLWLLHDPLGVEAIGILRLAGLVTLGIMIAALWRFRVLFPGVRHRIGKNRLEPSAQAVAPPAIVVTAAPGCGSIAGDGGHDAECEKALSAELAMKARHAAALIFCLLLAACASRSGDDARQKWCGVGGGAAAGALLPLVVGAYSAAPVFLAVGLLLAPVGAVVGAVSGAVNNPCPDAAPPPIDAEQKPTPQDSGETKLGEAEVR